MFADSETRVYNIEPQKHHSGEQKDGSSQTAPLVFSNKEIQLKLFRDATTQKNEEKKELKEINYEHLLQFLTAAEQLVYEELRSAENEAAIFQQFFIPEEQVGENLKPFCCLNGKCKDASILDMDFNCNGVAIGICYGANYHESWCNHEDYFTAVWFILRSEIKPEEPHYKIPSNGCPTSLRFHPSDPSLIAVSNYNGGICIWSIMRQDPVLLYSTINHHKDAILYSLWIADIFITAGMDGRIIFWNYNYKDKKISAQKTISLRLENLEMIKDPPAAKVPLGISCFDYSQSTDSLIIGTNLGYVFSCQNCSQNESIVLIGRHSGYVHNVEFLNSVENTAFSAAADSYVFLYSKGEIVSKFQSGGSLVACTGVSENPPKLSTVDSLGRYKIWKFENSRAFVSSSVAVSLKNEEEARRISKFRISKSNKSYTAVGFNGGEITVFFIPSNRK